MVMIRPLNLVWNALVAESLLVELLNAPTALKIPSMTIPCLIRVPTVCQVVASV